MRTWIICCVFAVISTMGCGDDENPPASPEIIDAKALCRDVMGVPKLVLVEVRVRDLNGTDDLGDPTLTVEANRLTMEREVIFPSGDLRCVSTEDCRGAESCAGGHCLEAGAVAPDLTDFSGCQNGSTGCDLRYIWERNGSSEQIFCDLEDSTLQIEFEVTDGGGNTLSGAILPETD